MLTRPDWAVDGAGWPHRASSRFVVAGGIRWHVQVAGHGPALLLLHGAGGSTHSWARLLPLLAPHFTVVAPDLPGHAFTAAPAPERFSLPGVAGLVAALLAELGVRPALAAGHSAGAAVALRMTLDGTLSPAGIAGLNPALAAFEPPLGPLRPLLYAVAGSEAYARIVSAMAVPAAVEATLASTGSRLDDGFVALYARLAASPGHVHGVMSMMSRWDVGPLIADYPRLDRPVVLVFGGRDRWIDRPAVEAVVGRIPRVRALSVDDTGHLTHEERPSAVADVILDLARETGVLAMP
jgi:magnesium chelatase accessory protein